jgi:chromosome segregation ATPase
MAIIENSDRGITLNKPFAWTLLVAVVSGSMWVGTTVATLSNKIDNLVQKEAVRSNEIGSLQVRLNAMERGESAMMVRMDNVQSSLGELKAELQLLNRNLNRLTP